MEKECIIVRNLPYLLEGYKDVMASVSEKMSGGIFMKKVFQRIVDDIESICSIEIYKVSARKWQITFIETEENSYNVEDDNLFLSQSNYNLKHITEQICIYQYNPMFGIKQECVCKGELERYPHSFAVIDENNKPIPQKELEKMSNYFNDISMYLKKYT